MAAYAIQFRRGTTTQHNSFTGLLGEVTVDTDKKTLVVHDGSTTGGFPLAREGAASNASTGSFTSNVTVGGTLAVTSTASFSDDVTITGDLGMTGHIIPSANITYDLGSPTMMWRDIYVGPGSLYVNGKKVIEDNNGSINFTTDANETLKLVVPGATGTLQFSAGSLQLDGEINAITGDITFGDHLDMNSNRIKNVSAPVEGADATNKTYVDTKISSELSGGTLAVDATTGDFSSNVTIGGSLTVTGTVTTVNSETIELADNILLLNSNALGNASQSGGIEVERGDDLNVQLLWDETNDRWSVGAEDFKAATFIGDLTGDVIGDVTGTVSSLSNHDTADLAESATNRYYTPARETAMSSYVDSEISTLSATVAAGAYSDSDLTDYLANNQTFFANIRANNTGSTVGTWADPFGQVNGKTIGLTEAIVWPSAASEHGSYKLVELVGQTGTGTIHAEFFPDVIKPGYSTGGNNVKLEPNAGGVVDVSNSKISNVSTPTDAADAANKAYADQAEADAIASAEAKDVVRAAAANAYADQAEVDAIASAEAKDVARAAAAEAYADQAEADAIASAEAKDVVRAAAAEAYADQAEADAIASAEAKDVARALTASNDRAAIRSEFAAADTTLQSNIDTEKGRIDAIMSASTSDADTFAEIVSLVNSVDTTNDNGLAAEITARTNADTALSGRLDTVEGSGTGSVAKAEADAIATASADATSKANAALASAQSYADQAEADAIASAEAKDVVRAAAANAYADQAEVDAKAYTDTRETAITTAYEAADTTLQSNIDTEKGRIDAIMSASTSDADTFAEIVALVNSVDTTNDNGLAAEITARTNADTALSGRLDVVEGTGTGSVAKALVDAKAYADQAEADAIASAEAKDVVRAAAANAYADQVEVDAKAYTDTRETAITTAYEAYADQAEADAITSATNLVANATGSNLNLGNKSTSNLSEGSNQYFTNARAVAAVEAALTHFHSAEQEVSATVATANATASVSFTFSELVGADHYAVYLNRMLLRPGEFTVSSGSTNNLTISTGVLDADDEIEVVGIKIT